MLPNNFLPYLVKKENLIRLGPKYDGGYIVHKKTLSKITKIITFGLNDDWNFEKDFLKKNRLCKVVAYDHTIDHKFWMTYNLNNIINFFLLKKLTIRKIINMFKYIDYLIFFSFPNQHILKKIGIRNNHKEISVTKIFNKIKKNEKIILKIDIEGDEYKILRQVSNIQTLIDHLIIEFHNVGKNISKVKSFIKKNNFLKLIHIHANNFGLIKNKIPDVLEMTFVNKKNYKIKTNKSIYKYPIRGLDYPNHSKKDDIFLNFNEK